MQLHEEEKERYSIAECEGENDGSLSSYASASWLWASCGSARPSRLRSGNGLKFSSSRRSFRRHEMNTLAKFAEKLFVKNSEFFIFERATQLTHFWWTFWGLSVAEVCKYCRSRQEFSNEYFVQKSASIQPRTSRSKFGSDSIHFFNSLLNHKRLRWRYTLMAIFYLQVSLRSLRLSKHL